MNQLKYNQLKYNQLISKSEYNEIEIMFQEWFNKIHFSDEQFHLNNEEEDVCYFRIDFEWIKECEDNCDYYSIYKQYLPEYVKRYREMFDKYMDMKIDEGLWSLNQLDREKLYDKWIVNYYPTIYDKYQILFQRYKNLADEYEQLNVDKEVEILKDAKMIGMTTTGAARLIDMINKLGVEVIVIEEAGEVLEAHSLALLCESLKHLILIGDHKQLRPSVVNFNLENKYHLTRSLFERLVLNGVDKVTLSTQRRMRPEISDLIRCDSLYPDLQDHENTLKRNNIRGLVYNVYFYDHKVLEPAAKEEEEAIHSKVNEYECKMIVHFVKYLLQVGYNPDQITILSFYLGQCQLIYEECKKLLGKDAAKQFRIVSVDNFQGEENNIIIFSAVRSNLDNKIGFCRVENRVNVALSRARDGLFLFGNMDCLIKGSHNRSVFPETNLWDYINETLLKKNMIGNTLPLVCPNHEDRFYSIEKPEDFAKYCPSGTCGQICKRRMKCGHSCKLQCHIDECEKHCLVLCKETLPCGHEYNGICNQRYTYKCKEIIEVDLPCKHKARIECFMRNALETPCNNILPCGHICKGKCFECKNGHISCKEQCVKILPCGHQCKGKCSVCLKSKKHQTCYEPCEKILKCGHKCKNNCYEECKCNETVEAKLTCGHKAKIKCSMRNNLELIECYEKLEKVAECGHTIDYYCCDKEKPNVFKCHYPCRKKLECGHLCQNKCGEECSSVCQRIVEVELPCGHKNGIECYMTNSLESPCKTILPCGHICKGNCNECKNGHIPCYEPCERLLECGHKCQKKCFEKCTENCVFLIKINGKYIRCGHTQYIECYKQNYPIQCQTNCFITLPCGHKRNIKCCMKDDLKQIKCYKPCNEILPCGHRCKAKCFQCKYGHYSCCEPCKKKFECGHTKYVECYLLNYPIRCKIDCNVTLPCGHNCNIECYMKDDLESVECHEPCDTILPCGHRCRGTCSKCKNRHVKCEECFGRSNKSNILKRVRALRRN